MFQKAVAEPVVPFARCNAAAHLARLRGVYAASWPGTPKERAVFQKLVFGTRDRALALCRIQCVFPGDRAGGFRNTLVAALRTSLAEYGLCVCHVQFVRDAPRRQPAGTAKQRWDQACHSSVAVTVERAQVDRVGASSRDKL